MEVWGSVWEEVFGVVIGGEVSIIDFGFMFYCLRPVMVARPCCIVHAYQERVSVVFNTGVQ